MVLKTLNIRQQRIVIPERWETKEVTEPYDYPQISAGYGTKRGNPGGIFTNLPELRR